MAQEGVEFTTPTGRIVWGHPAKAKPKTDNNNVPKLDKNGQQAMEWSFGLAIPKADFNAYVLPYLQQEAARGYPAGIPGAFSWKFIDGDGVDRNGASYATREGYAGCFVLAISSAMKATPMYKLNGAEYVQLPPEAVKCGDFVACGINAKVNIPTDRTHTPGIYVNPLAVEFVGYGTEIVPQGADPKALFGGQQRALPPGASAAPVAAANSPGMPGMGMAQPPAMPVPAPVAPAMPAPAPIAPAMPPMPAPPPPPPVPVAGPVRPTEPTHIAPNPAGGEFWFINGAWVAAAAPVMPPPAPDFTANAGMAGMPLPR